MVDRTSGEAESADETRTPRREDSQLGDSVAHLQRLVHEHYQSLYRYAYRLSGRQADAEDLTQQTFLIAQKKLHQLRDTDKADRWLFAILRSCFLKGVGRTRPVDLEAMDVVVEDAAERQRVSQALDREELQLALDGLVPEYRVIVLMFYFEDLSYKEIAEQLEIPIGTVMSRLARAKQRLRTRLFVGDEPGRPATNSRAPVPTR